MILNSCSKFNITSSLARFVFIALVMAAASSGCGCNGSGGGGSSGGGGGSGEVHLNQTGSSTGSVTTETISLDNCAGKETVPETLERSLDISIEGGMGVSINVLEADLRAKYARGQASSIELTAAPGTHMDYVVEWTEEAFFGDITVDGQSGKAKYTVRVPTASMTSTDRGCIAGKYDLVRWDEASSSYTLYMDVDSGRLTIDPSGDATWRLAIREAGEYPSPQPFITCKGRFYAGSQQLEGDPGGNAADWTYDMAGFAHDIWLTFCGWDVGSPVDPFTLKPRELGGGNRVLEMKNSKGTLIWER